MKKFYLGIRTAAGELIIYSQFHALHMLDAVAYVAHDDHMAHAVGLSVNKIEIGEVVDYQKDTLVIRSGDGTGRDDEDVTRNLLADLLWFFHGYRACRPECPIDERHLDALRDARSKFGKETS